MPISIRERYFSFTCVLAGALLAVDRLAWTPYIEKREALLEQKEAKSKALGEARLLLNKERRLRMILAKMGPSVEFDPSAAEVQFLHLVHDWEQVAGVSNASFHRVRAVEESGFTHLSYHVSAGGNIGAVASLIYAIETAPIPLRIDDLHLLPKKEGADLQVQMNVSTLCRKGGPIPRERPTSPETASLNPGGGRP